MVAWNAEEWQYKIIKAQHNSNFRALKYLWLKRVLGRPIRIRGRDVLHDWGKDVADSKRLWNEIKTFERLARETEFPPLKRPTLELWDG